jgi:hypothetical protein
MIASLRKLAAMAALLSMSAVAMAADPPASAASAASTEGLSPMQAALLSRADSIFTALGNTVEKAKDMAVEGGKMVAEQLPDIAYQYVAYGRAINTVYIAIAIAIMFIGWRVARKMNCDMGESEFFGRLFGGIAPMIVGVIVFLVNLKDFIMVWFAPKVWLIMEIAELVRKVRGH